MVANPLNPRDNLHQGVILIVSHTRDLSLGLQINRQLWDINLSDVAEQAGVDLVLDDPLYLGGPMNPNKIYVIHSTDWQGLTTIKLNDSIAVTNDISALAALSKDQGPECFRACAGFWAWQAGQLEAQLTSEKNSVHRWEIVNADRELVFELGSQQDQWQAGVAAAAREQIETWFNPVRD